MSTLSKKVKQSMVITGKTYCKFYMYILYHMSVKLLQRYKYMVYYLISVLTTVEGLVQRAIEGLSQDQPLRKVTLCYAIYYIFKATSLLGWP